MSAHIEWQPIKRGKAIYSSSLKSILEKEYGFPLDVNLDSSAMGFLKGLDAADVQEVHHLIEAIEKYDEIHVESHE